MYKWVILRNLQEVFIWTVLSCSISSTMNRQKRTEIAWMTTMKKLINQSGSFENTAKFNWQPMELFENRRICEI